MTSLFSYRLILFFSKFNSLCRFIAIKIVTKVEKISAIGWTYNIPFIPNKVGRIKITGTKQIPCLQAPSKNPLHPLNIFLNFNAVVVNLENLPENYQKECILKIEKNINILKGYLKTNIEEKKDNTEIPRTGMEVLNQQYVLAEAIEKWILELKEKLNF